MPRKAERFNVREKLTEAVLSTCREIVADFRAMPTDDRWLGGVRRFLDAMQAGHQARLTARRDALKALAHLRKAADFFGVKEPGPNDDDDPELPFDPSELSGTPWEWWGWFIDGSWLPPVSRKLSNRKLLVEQGAYIFGKEPGVRECSALHLLLFGLPATPTLRKAPKSVSDVLDGEADHFRSQIEERNARDLIIEVDGAVDIILPGKRGIPENLRGKPYRRRSRSSS